MALVTGSPGGVITAQSEIYIEGAPWAYFQDARAPLRFAPDPAGFHWGLFGTGSYPVYALGCYEDVSLASDYTINAIRCDKVGDKAVIQKLNHLEFSMTLTSLLDLATIAPILRAAPAQESAPYERMGIGPVDNSRYWHLYLAKVYDEVAGDYVAITLHRCQFVDAWTLAMPGGNRWALGGIKVWAFAEETLPAAQQFATIVRYDPSEIT